MRRWAAAGFTLVEVLIVVVILGVLASVAVVNVGQAAMETRERVTLNELSKLRSHVEVFRARHAGRLPAVEEGDGTWGPLIGREHLLAPPINAWIGGENAQVVRFGDSADSAYPDGTYGWIYDPESGRVWAAGFDSGDRPMARP